MEVQLNEIQSRRLCRNLMIIIIIIYMWEILCKFIFFKWNFHFLLRVCMHSIRRVCERARVIYAGMLWWPHPPRLKQEETQHVLQARMRDSVLVYSCSSDRGSIRECVWNMLSSGLWGSDHKNINWFSWKPPRSARCQREFFILFSNSMKSETRERWNKNFVDGGFAFSLGNYNWDSYRAVPYCAAAN